MTGFWLTNIFWVGMAAVCGGVLYRCRGGFIGTGSTTLARFMWWACPSAALLTLLHQAQTGQWSPLLFVLTTLALWIGLLIPHGWCQNKDDADYADMGVIGLHRMSILALVLIFFMPWYSVAFIVLGGSLQGVAYGLGWSRLDGKELIKWHPANPNADDGSGHDHFAISGGEWGEVLNGAFFWAVFVAASLPWL